MRRILLVVVASCAVLVAVPVLAVAHGSEHHKRTELHHKRAERHHRRHRRHHDRVRREHFGSRSSSNRGDQPEQGNAGTVASFTGGVLTITLTDGSTVSGAVTADTNIECEMAEPEIDMQAEDQGPGGGDNSGDDGGQGDDQGEDGQPCAPVMPGMVVRRAELRISSAGAVWDEVELTS